MRRLSALQHEAALQTVFGFIMFRSCIMMSSVSILNKIDSIGLVDNVALPTAAAINL